MDITVNRGKRSLKQISISGIIAGLFLLVLFAMIGYTGYMKFEYGRLNKAVLQKNDELIEKKRQLKKLQQNTGYLKYLAAKYVEQETRPIHRESSFKYLIELLEKLKEYNKTTKGVALANFQINSNKISLQGRVGSLKDIYAEGGIIDQFTSYPFIKSFRVPFYRKVEESSSDGGAPTSSLSTAKEVGKSAVTLNMFEYIPAGYEFLLDADIYHYDGTQGTP